MSRMRLRVPRDGSQRTLHLSFEKELYPDRASLVGAAESIRGDAATFEWDSHLYIVQ